MIDLNNILTRVCKLNGLGFIDNSKIVAENLFEDCLHLNDDGKTILKILIQAYSFNINNNTRSFILF